MYNSFGLLLILTIGIFYIIYIDALKDTQRNTLNKLTFPRNNDILLPQSPSPRQEHPLLPSRGSHLLEKRESGLWNIYMLINNSSSLWVNCLTNNDFEYGVRRESPHPREAPKHTRYVFFHIDPPFSDNVTVMHSLPGLSEPSDATVTPTTSWCP